LSHQLYPDSSAIVKEAIKSLGQGNIGLANKLDKDPSLISRYASGAVRPKAETLLKCMKLIDPDSVDELNSAKDAPDSNYHTLSLIKQSIDQLSSKTDAKVIQTVYSVLKLANKI
jgi:ribosome-binding protein aMBF1 (putative translation factor)